MSRVKRRSLERGDTLVEVAIAFSVLGIVLAGTSAIINRSLLSITNSVERTEARAEVNAQVELLRYVVSDYKGASSDTYKQITEMTNANVDADQGCTASNNAYYLKWDDSKKSVALEELANKGEDQSNAADGAPHAGRGIWIDAKRGSTRSTKAPGYIDFYVRACWTPYLAQSLGEGHLETIVRIALPLEDD